MTKSILAVSVAAVILTICLLLVPVAAVFGPVALIAALNPNSYFDSFEEVRGFFKSEKDSRSYKLNDCLYIDIENKTGDDTDIDGVYLRLVDDATDTINDLHPSTLHSVTADCISVYYSDRIVVLESRDADETDEAKKTEYFVWRLDDLVSEKQDSVQAIEDKYEIGIDEMKQLWWTKN